MMNKESNYSDLYQERMRIFTEDVTVYPVTCEELCLGRSDYQWLDAVLAGGAKLVQLRDKKSDDRTLLKKAKYFREKTKAAEALFLVNDRIDIALLSDADGVHVGQDDLPVEEIRKLAPDWIIGLSCASKEQAVALQKKVDTGINGASYYNIGPIYSTATKDGLSFFLGAPAIPEIAACCELPFTVMGGIKFAHIEDVVAAGASHLAVVTAITGAEDMAAETARWVATIKTLRQLK